MKQHEIGVEVEPGLPLLSVDEQPIRQVLINLIRNAAQAMEQPGTIVLRAHRRPNRRDIVRIEVEDTGRGIPEEIRDRIFEPFFSTNDAEGTGLGLDICRQVIERHSGRIWCESTVGDGTTMIVELPLATQPMASADAPDD